MMNVDSVLVCYTVIVWPQSLKGLVVILTQMGEEPESLIQAREFGQGRGFLRGRWGSIFYDSPNQMVCLGQGFGRNQEHNVYQKIYFCLRFSGVLWFFRVLRFCSVFGYVFCMVFYVI